VSDFADELFILMKRLLVLLFSITFQELIWNREV